MAVDCSEIDAKVFKLDALLMISSKVEVTPQRCSLGRILLNTGPIPLKDALNRYS